MNRLIWYGDKIQQRIEKQARSLPRRIAEVIARRAKRNAPVKSGELRDSISATDDGVEATAGYATTVELGSAKQAAQPYMRPAIEQFNKADLDNIVN